MMKLFEGYMGAHGVYNIPANAVPDENGKVKGNAATIRTPVTVELWDSHLCGKQGLGIIPINENSEVRFGAIDIDEYTWQSADVDQIRKTVIESKWPLVMCRSKSGGLHLYLFCQEFVPAKLLYGKLKEMAAHLGFGNSEIYPRQTQVVASRGDIGQWINVPYFDAADTERYCIDYDGKKMPIERFVLYAQERQLTTEGLRSLSVSNELLTGGPPCLNILASRGFPAGTRNNGLFNLGVYAMKLDPDNWPTLLEQLNNRYMDPPLGPREVLGVVSSLKKKEYTYSCNQEPIKSFCDMNKCRLCKYGVGGLTGMPVMGTLTKVNTVPPIWFLDVQGGSRIELSTEELQNPMRFQKRCMDAINLMPPVVKRDVWEYKVAELLKGVVVVDMPEDSSPTGQVLEHLRTFLTSSVQAKKLEELILGKPFTNEQHHCFRLKDFHAYLKRLKFDEMRQNKINQVIKEYGGEPDFAHLNGVGTNYWKVPLFKNRQTKSFDTPSFVDGDKV